MRRKFGVPWIRMALLTSAASACGDDGLGPGPALRFGQSGQLVVNVVTQRRPLPSDGLGELRQTLTWRSTGAWQLSESISYRGRIGSEIDVGNPGDPGAFASAYATLVAQINGGTGLNLFIEGLDPLLSPNCDLDGSQARVILRVQDEIRGEERSWTRCAAGPLGSLNPAGSGPDVHASRVVQVSRLIHDRTLGDSATSVYGLSVPFATLDKGARPGDLELAPQVFFGGPGAHDAPPGWKGFWRWHAGEAPLPDVDWAADMVVIAGDGARREAGSAVEVRAILPVRDGAIVQLVERAPGDFCSPAAVVQTPFHLVVAPRLQSRIRFSEIALQRVPCGL